MSRFTGPSSVARPIPWWFWTAFAFAPAAAFFISASGSFLWSVIYIVVWFTGLVVLGSRERRYRAEVAQARELVRAEVVEALPSGRRVLPAASGMMSDAGRR